MQNTVDARHNLLPESTSPLQLPSLLSPVLVRPFQRRRLPPLLYTLGTTLGTAVRLCFLGLVTLSLRRTYSLSTETPVDMSIELVVVGERSRT